MLASASGLWPLASGLWPLASGLWPFHLASLSGQLNHIRIRVQPPAPIHPQEFINARRY
jgi:hypothetical protein